MKRTAKTTTWAAFAGALALYAAGQGIPTGQPAVLAGSGLPGAKLDLAALLAQHYPAGPDKQTVAGVYIGSEFCLACHPSQAGWRETLHASFLRRPLTQYSLMPRKGVIADFDANGVDDFLQGLDFNAIDSVFDAYKPNAPVLGVVGGRYTIRIGEVTYPVTFTQAGQGGGSSQRYAVKIPVTDSATGLSDSNYFAPLTFIPGSGWVPNGPGNWYDGSNQPRFGPETTIADLADHGGNYSATCVGCHATGIREVGPMAGGEVSFQGFVAVLSRPDDPGTFDYDGDGFNDLMNIGCESCHGPGSVHVAAGGDPEYIVNPANLPGPAQVDVCGRCHSRPHSVPNGTFDWPYDDANGVDWTPLDAVDGVSLTDFFTDASVRWPDGKHGSITRPYMDFVESSKPTFPFRMVSCSDCHDPHQEAQRHQIRDHVIEDGIRIDTAVEDNTLCLACHAGHGDFEELNAQTIADIEEEANRDAVARAVSAHSNHPYGPERSMGLANCIDCHMPLTYGFGAASGRSHTFEAIAPHKTLEFQEQGGMPNSCAQSCHNERVNSFGLRLDPNPDNKVWDEPFDRSLAEELQRYYGPGGLWWDTEEEGDGE